MINGDNFFMNSYSCWMIGVELTRVYIWNTNGEKYLFILNENIY